MDPPSTSTDLVFIFFIFCYLSRRFGVSLPVSPRRSSHHALPGNIEVGDKETTAVSECCQGVIISP